MVVAELVLAVVLVLVVGVLTFVWVRRRLIAGDGRPVMLCALRDSGSSRWRLGLARLGAQRFEWFSIVGPSMRPEVSWLRGQVDLGTPQPLAWATRRVNASQVSGGSSMRPAWACK